MLVRQLHEEWSATLQDRVVSPHSSVVALYPCSIPLYKAPCILCHPPLLKGTLPATGSHVSGHNFVNGIENK